MATAKKTDVKDEKAVEEEETPKGPSDKQKEKSIWVSNGYMDRTVNQLTEIFQSFLSRDIPPRPSYWIARALDKMESVVKTYSKKKQELLEEHADKDMEGKAIVMPTGGYQMEKGTKPFMDAIEPFAEIEVDLGIEPIEISIEELEEKGINVPAGEFKAIMPLLKVIEPGGKKEKK